MDQRPVRIFSTEDVPRLRYIASVILGDILGLSWDLITDKRKLGKFPVINYSDENIGGSFKIHPDPLLFEKGIAPRDIAVKNWSGIPVFFQCDDSDLPFDIFAASFFLVSRYEEYLDFEPDQFGRFRAASSLAFRNNFLGIPVVDLWAREFSRALLKKFQTITFRRNEFKSILTIDTDQAFAYLGKSIFRSIGGLLNDLTDGKKAPGNRYRTVSRAEKDPFDVFEYITGITEKYNQDVRFFFPVGDYSSFDKNPSWKNAEYRKLITGINEKYRTGLHPSYFSSGDLSMTGIEKDRLQEIVDKEIYCSRFHFIRLFMPRSYLNLCDLGITEDYSMGYPEEPGFRAGIARPFFFYDLTGERMSGLKVFPFQVMDGTLFQYKKLDPDAAIKLILDMMGQTKKAGGLFISIWHNTSLLDNEEWKRWREVFEFMIKNQNHDSLS